MKKIFTFVALALATFTASATDYTGALNVSVNGAALPEQETTVTIVENDDQSYGMELSNLVLVMGGAPIGVGNIVLDGVPGIQGNGSTLLLVKDTIQIAAGTTPGIPFWMGPTLGDVPIDMKGEIRGGQLYFSIAIDMTETSLGQAITVTFGDNFQIKNSGFEAFHTASVYDADSVVTASSDEPNNWHSFMSCTGSMASFVNGLPHTFISEETRPGSTGSKSVLITSSGVKLGIVELPIAANGTLTTGRLQAGSANAADPANNACLDLANDSTFDENGDPFHALLNARPDSVAVWVKFKQGTVDEENPYATLSAVVTDGTYYQDPENPDSTYNNVVAKASDTRIATNGFEWQRLSIPFDYETYAANGAEAKAILVTISTNATPGGGSTKDSLYVDDFELVYNSTVTGITVKGKEVADFDPETTEYVVELDEPTADITAEDIVVSTNANGAKVFCDVAHLDNEDGGSVATITVCSADLKAVSTYVVETKTSGVIDCISGIEAGSGEVEAVYNLNGQRVEAPAKGQVYVVKYTDGRVVKAVVK